MSGKIQFEDIYKKTGIKTIYKSSEEENTLTLAIDASKKVLNELKNIESLIFVSQPHVSSIPKWSILHEKLNLNKECFVLDHFSFYALITAVNLIKNKEFKN